MQKIVFLDIDGVLNSGDWYDRYHEQHLEKDPKFDYDLDPLAIETLNELKRLVPSVKIVITSTWRFDYKDAVERLNAQGLEIPIIDRTSVEARYHEGTYMPRGVLVKKWLDENVKDTCNYVIFDDDIDFLIAQKNNFVHTNFEHGIQMSDISLAAAILGREESDKVKLC